MVFIYRKGYLDQILPFVDKPVVKVITGIRRSGKSTLLKQITAYLHQQKINPENIVSINMELMENQVWKDNQKLNKFLLEKKRQTSQKIYLLIDEIQEIDEWEKVINSLLAREGFDIYITGSNSRLLSGELASYLTGRYIECCVQPFSFQEFLQIRNITQYQEQDFYDYLKFGGLPGIHHLDFNDDAILQYLFSVGDSILYKDVVMRNQIRDVALLEKLIWYVASNIGNTFSARRVSDYLKKERRSLSPETIYNYLSHLEAAFYLQKVERFDLVGKRILETYEKYYLTDIGIINAKIGFKEHRIQSYLENIVYLELKRRGFRVFIGKLDDLEIDFIAERYDQRKYFQVTYLLVDDNVRQREFRPLMQIRDNYPKYVLSMDRIPESNNEGIIRKYLPDFLLGEW